MSELTKLGLILALISGIIAVVTGIVEIIGETVAILTFGTVNFGGDVVGGVVRTVLGVILIYIYMGRIQLIDPLVLGIVIIVIGVLGGGTLATIGGILILVDYFFVTSSTTTRRR